MKVINKKEILIVFGTRPEAIKMAPIIKGLNDRTSKFDVEVCLTGQHSEMLKQAIRMFDVTANINLNIMKPNQDLFDITSNVIVGLKKILAEKKPDLVLVHGDTTTSFATSLACFYLRVPVAHVEAGLRTYDSEAPFPEEINRVIISRLAKWHFSPTKMNKKNLLLENIPKENIFVTGNTVIDALFWTLRKIESSPSKQKKIETSIEKYINSNVILGKFILITGHRRENIGLGLKNICLAIKHLSKKFQKIHFLYPVHSNPKVNVAVKSILSGISNIHLTDPIPYEEFIYLMKKCFFVITDSGGVQEEAPSLGKPVLVLRQVTERPEGIKAGTVKVIGTSKSDIIAHASELIENRLIFEKMTKAKNPYGDGNAAVKIVEILEKLL